ncbi:Fis family transcriptional regulator [Psychrosphaera ytuae]|uniref:Fis family transcriptional regulator n=1 Tax=Psychrosphaera ytuae TaxID=2820710 RepID=A0A975HL85_9GAMM|nr:Fis family transcriptional regulator [Psychrosphaera ytuae]QTH65099.1 Fis family transcriptional regulator [Psychrosphaera ytuae]
MKKSDKKLDNQIRQTLTELCESRLEQIEGFEWLTHVVNFNRFPESLRVVCVFCDDESLTKAKQSGTTDKIQTQITQTLAKLKITFNKPAKQIIFDTETRCQAQHGGNWAKRLQSL